MKARSDERDGAKIILRRDLCLIFCLLALAGVFLLCFSLFAPRGKYAKVSVNGETVLLAPLDRDGDYVLNGGTNTLRVRDGRASVIDADCPDKLCEKQGSVSRVGQRIICLPNRLTVEIVGGAEGEEPDLILFAAPAAKGGGA